MKTKVKVLNVSILMGLLYIVVTRCTLVRLIIMICNAWALWLSHTLRNVVTSSGLNVIIQIHPAILTGHNLK